MVYTQGAAPHKAGLPSVKEKKHVIRVVFCEKRV